jgi:hypothetical protein
MSCTDIYCDVFCSCHAEAPEGNMGSPTREAALREQQLAAMQQVQQGLVGDAARSSAITARLSAVGKNPKAAYGDKKPRLSLVPLSGQLAQFEAQFDGKLKYGEVNWRINPIEALTYVDAAIRHLKLYENGENFARDTKVQNLGAVMACCAILIDAELHGTLIDNRNHSPQTCDLLHGRGEQVVAMLQDMQRERDKLKEANGSNSR